MSPKRLPWV